MSPSSPAAMISRALALSGGAEYRHIEELTHVLASAGDVALALAITAIVGKGRDPEQGGARAAGDPSQLGQQDRHGHRGGLTDAGRAAQRLDPLGQRRIGSGLLIDQLFQRRDRRAQARQRGLHRGPGGVRQVLDRLGHVRAFGDQQPACPDQLGQLLARRLDRHWRGVDQGGGKLGNHPCVDRVGLGPSPLGLGEMAHARRVKDVDLQASRAQHIAHCAFVAAAGFQPDPGDAALREPDHQPLVIRRLVFEPDLLASGMDCDVEEALPAINARGLNQLWHPHGPFLWFGLLAHATVRTSRKVDRPRAFSRPAMPWGERGRSTRIARWPTSYPASNIHHHRHTRGDLALPFALGGLLRADQSSAVSAASPSPSGDPIIASATRPAFSRIFTSITSAMSGFAFQESPWRSPCPARSADRRS